jgi:hypothetical protein
MVASWPPDLGKYPRSGGELATPKPANFTRSGGSQVKRTLGRTGTSRKEVAMRIAISGGGGDT